MAGHPAPVDWRGTTIRPGALVIYGAPVGRSISMVEGTVSDPMLTPSGRIWVDVIRRSYGGYDHTDGGERVHVGADRLTIVDQLPATTAPTQQQQRQAAKSNLAERARNYDTHPVLDHRTKWDDRWCPACGTRGASALSDGPCRTGLDV